MTLSSELMKIAAAVDLMEVKNKEEAVKALEGMSDAEREEMEKRMMWPRTKFRNFQMAQLREYLKALNEIRKGK